MVPIFITLLGCDQISVHVPRLFILFNFFSFSLWILYIAGARETQEDTLWVFITKIKRMDKNTGVKVSVHDNNNKNKWQAQY